MINGMHVFQSNMSENTVDGNCMTKKMWIVMFSTKPSKGEKIIPMYKMKLFFIWQGSNLWPQGFYLALYSASNALDPSAILAY